MSDLLSRPDVTDVEYEITLGEEGNSTTVAVIYTTTALSERRPDFSREKLQDLLSAAPQFKLENPMCRVQLRSAHIPHDPT